MRFLLHGQLGPDVATQLAEAGHQAVTVEGLNLDPAAPPAEVLDAARRRQVELITADGPFLRAILPGSGRKEVFGRVIVYLQDAPADHALSVMRLFERYKRLTPGRLYTVTAGRVKVRQLPSAEM